MKLFDSELEILQLLWDNGPMTAGAIAKALKDRIGWSRNTTYTVIGKCVEKGAVTRSEPRYTCTAAVSQEDAQKGETDSLINRMFGGSRTRFFAAFLRDENLSSEELAQLRELIDKETGGA